MNWCRPISKFSTHGPLLFDVVPLFFIHTNPYLYATVVLLPTVSQFAQYILLSRRSVTRPSARFALRWFSLFLFRQQESWKSLHTERSLVANTNPPGPADFRRSCSVRGRIRFQDAVDPPGRFGFWSSTSHHGRRAVPELDTHDSELQTGLVCFC